MEKTLIILKPDAVQRQLMGRIIARLEDKGLQIVAAKFMQISRPLAEKHYAVHKGKPFYDGLLQYITRGPVLGWGAWAGTHPGALHEQWAGLERLLTSGEMAPPEPIAYPLEQAATAVASLENRSAKGKVVLRVRG